MKSKECKKHDHKLTHFLKVFIYMCVMLAPFFAIGIKCWYVATNKNAYQSYKGQYSFDGNILVESTSQYQLDTRYSLVNSQNIRMIDAYNSRGYSFGDSVTYKYLFIKDTNYTFNSNDYEYSMYRLNTVGQVVAYTPTQQITIPNIQFTNASLLISSQFELASLNEVEHLNVNYFTYPTFITDNTLSSVFYSAVDELDDASIFSWTTNTGIYTAINNMCINLGIVSPPLAVLLTYWSLITAIYIVIDIVIETFTFLTHWFTDKMV